MPVFVMEYIRGIFPREIGRSRWVVRPVGDCPVAYPRPEAIARIASACFGQSCYVDGISGQGAWKNAVIIVIPTESEPVIRDMFLRRLAERIEHAANSGGATDN